MSLPKLPRKLKCRPVNRDGSLLTEDADIQFDIWYSELEAWHAEVFKDAVVVKGQNNHMWSIRNSEIWGNLAPSTHQALLIKIQLIKNETAEDVLRRWVDAKESCDRDGYRFDVESFWASAKAFLDKKN